MHAMRKGLRSMDKPLRTQKTGIGALWRCSFAILAFCAILLTLSGCHGSRGLQPFVIPSTFDQAQQYEITFWAKNDTNKTQTDIYRKAIADFETLYPNITVNLRLYTDYGKIYNDVITNLSTNTTPNVCITYPDHIATYLTSTNAIVPLDGLFTDSRYGLGGSEIRFHSPSPSEIVPQFLQECAIEGTYYAIPYMRSTEACYVNKTFVEALGYTLPETLSWDFVWSVSAEAMAKDEEGKFIINDQTIMIPFIYKSTDNMMIQQIRQKGAPYTSTENRVLLFNDTTTELLYTIADAVKLGAFSTFKISSYPANFLNAGQCIFAIDSTAGATWMGSEAPLIDISEDKLVPFEIAVLPIPQFDQMNPLMISQGPSVCIFNKSNPQEVLASWLFAQYLLNEEVQIAYAQTEGYVPVTTIAQQSAVYQDYLSRSGEDNTLHYDVKIKASTLLLDHTQHTFVTPVWNGSASLRDAAGQLIENVTKSIRRNELVDDAYIEKLYQEVNALYRLPQGGAQGTGISAGGRGDEFGPLPQPAIVLLLSLLSAWVFLAIYAVGTGLLKEKRKKAEYNIDLSS